MMTILLVGATLFYEKKEHTINSIMVSPVTENEYLLAKVLVNAGNALITVFFISAAVYLIKSVTYNYLLLLPAVLLVTITHTLLGIRLAYDAKDFILLTISWFMRFFPALCLCSLRPHQQECPYFVICIEASSILMLPYEAEL